MGEIRIAHISDLHFTSQMGWDPKHGPTDPNADWAARLLALKRDLSLNVRPHVLMVTGDIADNTAWELAEQALDSAWLNARHFLEGLAQTVIDPPDEWPHRLFVIPGNHDAKVLGNVRREELVALTQNKLFRAARWSLAKATKVGLGALGLSALYPQVSPLFDQKLQEALQQSAPSDSTRFAKMFSAYMSHAVLPALGMAVFCVDSNSPHDSFLNFAQGMVAPGQAAALVQQAADCRSHVLGFEHFEKVVLMHHHPLPLARTEGIGPRFEGEEFHLLKNAGSVLRVCLDLGFDFILHGHKHAQGCSIVSYPNQAADALDHPVIVVGAGSAQHALNNCCSYNVIRRSDSGDWWVAVRTRQDGRGSIAEYHAEGAEMLVMTREQRRKRLFRIPPFGIHVGRLDLLAKVDEHGDLTASAYLTRIQPSKKEAEISEYPIFWGNESPRATIEITAEGCPEFADAEAATNMVRGVFRLGPPATHADPADLKVNMRGVGLYTFSQEYSQWLKGAKRECFTFTSRKMYDEVLLDITFPEEFEPIPIDPEVLVFHASQPESQLHPDILVREGLATIDDTETASCRRRLRVWPDQHRLSLLVRLPLPNATYALLWGVPPDEYHLLPNETHGPLPHLQQRVRGAIQGLHQRLKILDIGGADVRHEVRVFLEKCGTEVLKDLNSNSPLRVDLGINIDGRVTVVAAIQSEPGSGWVQSALRPKCSLGETLRGKAYLRREVIGYAPGIPDNAKNPNRHHEEEQTQHQVAIPLVYPPEGAFWPRVGVLTLSSESSASPLSDLILKADALGNIIRVAHQQLASLAVALGGSPFPSL